MKDGATLGKTMTESFFEKLTFKEKTERRKEISQRERFRQMLTGDTKALGGGKSRKTKGQGAWQ